MDSPKRKILVIDDQEEIGAIFKRNLPQMGNYEVQSCMNGKEGIIMARHFRPDVIFLDVMMPGMSGTDTAEVLQDDLITTHIPIIFITGLVSKDELTPGTHQIGGREFLPKPFQMDQVVKMIDRVLNKKNENPQSI